jgi:hypothetical protein
MKCGTSGKKVFLLYSKNQAEAAASPSYKNSTWKLVIDKDTGVHFNRLECNTAMGVISSYTLPGVRILHSCETCAGARQIR